MNDCTLWGAQPPLRGFAPDGARLKTLARFVEPAGSNQISAADQIKKAAPYGVAFLIWWAVMDSNHRPIG